MDQHMQKTSRFIYINTYSFLLLICGIAVALVPFFQVSKLLVIPQVILFFICIKYSMQIFSTWKGKKKRYAILMERNKKHFRPDTFEPYMQAPCGRLLTKVVLKDLGLEKRYKDLLIYKPSLIESIKKNCTPVKTTIYINEDYK